MISYAGLDTVTIPLQTLDGASVTKDVALSADIYRMQAFTVEGEREGSAMATTRQRLSANVKNVVATDAFGTMTEDNVGAFLQKIPGIVATDVSGSGVREVMVRGIEAGLNTVEMDGVQLANNNSTGTNRAFDFFQASLSLIESIEVTKAPTPDRPANSIGGSINMVTRSAFNRNAPRQIRYSLGFAHLIGRKGGDAEQWIDAPIDRLTPALTLGYTDVFGPQQESRRLALVFAQRRFLLLERHRALSTRHPGATGLYVPHAAAATGDGRAARAREHRVEGRVQVERAVALHLQRDAQLLHRTAAHARAEPANDEQREPDAARLQRDLQRGNPQQCGGGDDDGERLRQLHAQLSLPRLRRAPARRAHASTTAARSRCRTRSRISRRTSDKYDAGVETKGNISVGGLTGIGWITDRRAR